MKVLLVILFTVAALAFTTGKSASDVTQAQADSPETTAARVPLENYIQAHATGNGEFIRKAFFKDAKIMAFRDGKLLNLTTEEFAARFDGKPAADESQRKH